MKGEEVEEVSEFPAKVLCHDGADGASTGGISVALNALRVLCPDGDAGFYELLIKLGQLHSNKSVAYDNEHDYQMIRAVANRHGLSPVEVVMIYMDKHFEAILRLIKEGDKDKIESVSSRLFDLANYSLIAVRLVDVDEG